MNKQPRFIILHHTGGTEKDPLFDTSNQTFEDVNNWHRQSPLVWLGKLSSLGYAIGYTYFIDKTGKITQGRADNEQSAHCKGYNNNPTDHPSKTSIGICLAGNFDVTFPTPEQKKSLELLLLKKTAEYSIPKENIVPHRSFANKSCFGRNLPDNWGQSFFVPVVSKPVESMCIAQEKEIVALKKEVDGYKSWFDWFVKMFS